jgi:radial spoke head protein 9
MNIYRVSEDLRFVNRIGETLSVKEKYIMFIRLGVDIGIQRLLETEKLDTIMFWGRIRGTTKDYYLAIGLKFKDEYEFPAKRFYWR